MGKRKKKMERRPIGDRITISIYRGKKRVLLEVERLCPVDGYSPGYDPALVTVRSDEGTVFKCGRKAIIR